MIGPSNQNALAWPGFAPWWRWLAPTHSLGCTPFTTVGGLSSESSQESSASYCWLVAGGSGQLMHSRHSGPWRNIAVSLHRGPSLPSPFSQPSSVAWQPPRRCAGSRASTLVGSTREHWHRARPKGATDVDRQRHMDRPSTPTSTGSVTRTLGCDAAGRTRWVSDAAGRTRGHCRPRGRRGGRCPDLPVPGLTSARAYQCPTTARPASRRAIGTRKGLHDT
jgi:hypothetical protein